MASQVTGGNTIEAKAVGTVTTVNKPTLSLTEILGLYWWIAIACIICGLVLPQPKFIRALFNRVF